MRQGGIGNEPEYRHNQKEAAQRRRDTTQHEERIQANAHLRASLDRVADHQASAYKQRERHESEKRSRDWWTFGALVAAACAAILTLIVTHCDNRAIIQESENDTAGIIRESRRVSDQQHSDTLAALNQTEQEISAMRGQANAASVQAEQSSAQTVIAQQGLIATTRPWIELAVSVPSIYVAADRIVPVIIVTAKNIGHSPANHVTPEFNFLTDFMAFEQQYRDRSACNPMNKRPQKLDRPTIIFPGDVTIKKPLYLLRPTVVDPTNKPFTLGVALCVYYMFEGSPYVHSTSISFFVSKESECEGPRKTQCGNMFEFKKPRNYTRAVIMPEYTQIFAD